MNRALWICLWTVLKAESPAFQENNGMIGGFRWLGLINFELDCQVAGIGDFIFNFISEWHF